jgi:choloylglycine hydrolase
MWITRRFGLNFINLRHEERIVMRTSSKFLMIVLASVGGVFANSTASACTGIRLTAQDGSLIYARTMENAIDIQSNMIIVPHGKQYIGTGPEKQPGMPWTTKYGFVGPNAFDQPYVCDGLNEKGLAIGNFQFTDFAKFQAIDAADANRVIASYEVATFLLGTCSTVEEALSALNSVRVCEAGTTADDHAMGDFHYFFHDAGGNCAVVEYVDGKMIVHKNPLGVLTNSPPFDWQVTNLRNYLHLDVDNAAPITFSGTTFTGFGQGTGLLGLPGDFTPPSRFVRAVTFTRGAYPAATAEECVEQAFHLLNQFDIPPGTVRTAEGGKPMYECTRWTSAADLKNLRYYFHTFESRRIRAVDLKKADFDAKNIRTISMRGPEIFEELTPSVP